MRTSNNWFVWKTQPLVGSSKAFGAAWDATVHSGTATSKALTVGVMYKASSGVVVTIKPSGTPSISAPATVHNDAWTVSWTGVAGATNCALDERKNGSAWQLVQNTSA